MSALFAVRVSLRSAACGRCAGVPRRRTALARPSESPILTRPTRRLDALLCLLVALLCIRSAPADGCVSLALNKEEEEEEVNCPLP